MLEHNFMQFWSFIFSLASLALVSSLVGIRVFFLFKARKTKQAEATATTKKFTCGTCGEEINLNDFDKHDTSLYTALEKLKLCELCLRGEKRDRRNKAQKLVAAIDEKANKQTATETKEDITLRKHVKILNSSESDKEEKPIRAA